MRQLFRPRFAEKCFITLLVTNEPKSTAVGRSLNWETAGDKRHLVFFYQLAGRVQFSRIFFKKQSDFLASWVRMPAFSVAMVALSWDYRLFRSR
jgi:hypothetical protein